jgi:hypothetical protein
MSEGDSPPSSSGLSKDFFTTKDFLLRLDNKMDRLDGKVDDVVTRQTRIETILTEGKYGERLYALETFKNKTEGAPALAKWAVGGSGIALVAALASLYLTISGH